VDWPLDKFQRSESTWVPGTSAPPLLTDAVVESIVAAIDKADKVDGADGEDRGNDGSDD